MCPLGSQPLLQRRQGIYGSVGHGLTIVMPALEHFGQRAAREFFDLKTRIAYGPTCSVGLHPKTLS